MRRPEFRLWTRQLAVDMMTRGRPASNIIEPDTEDTEEENGPAAD